MSGNKRHGLNTHSIRELGELFTPQKTWPLLPNRGTALLDFLTQKSAWFNDALFNSWQANGQVEGTEEKGGMLGTIRVFNKRRAVVVYGSSSQHLAAMANQIWEAGEIVW